MWYLLPEFLTALEPCPQIYYLELITSEHLSCMPLSLESADCLQHILHKIPLFLLSPEYVVIHLNHSFFSPSVLANALVIVDI